MAVTPPSETLHPVPDIGSPLAGEGCPTPLAWQEVRDAVRMDGERHRIEFGRVKLAATKFGAGEPLYLLPGFFGDHELCVLTSWLLREECCSVMVDPPMSLPGGRTSPAALMQEWSVALLALADSLGHDRLRLHGPNFGGMLALQIMSDHPQRVSAASLQCAFPTFRSTWTERLIASVGRRSGRSVKDVGAAMRIQESNHRRWFPPFDGSRWDFYAANIGATPVAEAALRAKVAAEVDLSGELSGIDTPVLVIVSEGDGPVARSAQQQLSAGLKNSRVELIDNCGRLPHVTHPHRLVKLLRAFWEDARTGQSGAPV